MVRPSKKIRRACGKCKRLVCQNCRTSWVEPGAAYYTATFYCLDCRTRKEAGADLKHGTVTTYRIYKCRCEECKEANNAAARRWRASHPGSGRRASKA
jgi:hypothetical protein